MKGRIVMTEREIMNKARAALIEELKLGDFPYQVGIAEFGEYVEVEGIDTMVPVTIKVTAHKYAGDNAFALEDADEDYRLMMKSRDDKAKLRAEKKALKEKKGKVE